MIRYRWAIPATLGAVCIILGLASLVLSHHGTVEKWTHGFSSGKTAVFKGIRLDKAKHYTLEVAPINGRLPVNASEDLAVSLTMEDEDETEVFELEDSYWHQTGVWHEDGESGTWDESNDRTSFDFIVPKSGIYDLKVSLDNITYLADALHIRIDWRTPWVLTAWPLFIGAFILFGVAGWASTTRRQVMGEFLEGLGVGSKLKIGSVQYEVLDRSEIFEGLERTGVEYRLRATIGTTRYLSIDRYWRDHPYLEDRDQVLVETLIDVALDPDDEAYLASVDPMTAGVMIGKTHFAIDTENSGTGALVSVRNGATFRSRFTSRVFRDPLVFPIRAGGQWLEHTTWHDSPREDEWTLYEIVDWNEIDVIELQTPALANHETAQLDPDPFGVHGGAGTASSSFGPVDNRTAQSQPSQQQQSSRNDRDA